MRKVTIKRAKSLVACLVKIKIYIEDYSASDILINKIPCRKLGDIKNGEEKTFEIGEHPAKIFAIVDKLSKDYCNDFYELPEGQEDVFLSGKNCFNPASGNAFRFNNNENEATVVNRKRGTLKGLIVLICAIIIGLVVGYLLAEMLLN